MMILQKFSYIPEQSQPLIITDYQLSKSEFKLEPRMEGETIISEQQVPSPKAWHGWQPRKKNNTSLPKQKIRVRRNIYTSFKTS